MTDSTGRLWFLRWDFDRFWASVFHIVGKFKFGFEDPGGAISGDADVRAFAGVFWGWRRCFRVGLGLGENIPAQSWARLLLRLGSCWRDIGKGQV